MTEWVLPRESEEWVGPITFTGPYPVQYAVVLRGRRPTNTDWADPVVNPEPGHASEFGVMAYPVSETGHWQIFAKILAGTEVPVRGPYEIGTIRRS